MIKPQGAKECAILLAKAATVEQETIIGNQTRDSLYSYCTGNRCEQTAIFNLQTGENQIRSNCEDGNSGVGSRSRSRSGSNYVVGPILKKLCTSSYAWTVVSHGYTVEINHLIAPFQSDDRRLQAIARFDQACITIPIFAVGTTNNATIEFNEAWNRTVNIIKNMIENNTLQPTDYLVKQAFKAALKTNYLLQSVVTDGPCYGGVGATNALFCNRSTEQL